MRVGRNGLVLAVTLGLAAALLLGGCATILAAGARDTGRLLIEAGFRTEPAEAPTEIAGVAGREPLRLVARWRDGGVVYTYADPYACRCLYVGGPAERAMYERLAAQRARDEQDLAAGWDGWSPWWWR